MKFKSDKNKSFFNSYIVIICFQILIGYNFSYAKESDEKDDRSRFAYVVNTSLNTLASVSSASLDNPVSPVEDALVVYNKWLKNGGSSLTGKDFKNLSAGDKVKIKQLMSEIYPAAGEGARSFKNVALLIQHGYDATGKSFEEAGYTAHKIDDNLSKCMASLRDSMIEDLIIEIGQENNYKIARSDSGNLESGMKSDLDQTFYVYELSEDKKSWVRNEDLDEKFIKLFEQKWLDRHGKLKLKMLDVVSIEGKNRFPDPRAVSVENFSKLFDGTIKELRSTPGAYTTFGAVTEQMQFRALAEIEQANKRAFQVYGPDEGNFSSSWKKHSDFNRDLALNSMFFKDATPELMKGQAFGAAVANYFELLKYMDKDKFETKYHLRTWEDCMHTLRLLEKGKGKKHKKKYLDMGDAERNRLNKRFLNQLFKDAKKKREHTLALEISRELRLLHKGQIDAKRKDKIFDDLAAEMFGDRFQSNPKDQAGIARKEIQIKAVKNHHRRLASEFCLESLYYSSKDAFKVMLNEGSDSDNIFRRTRHLLKIKDDVKWTQTKQNLSEASRLTLLYAIYDLGVLRSADLMLKLNADVPGHRGVLFNTWIKGQFVDLSRQWEKFDSYKSLENLENMVTTHVFSEFGFKEAESADVAHIILKDQNLVWNWRQFAKNMFLDVGTIDSAAQIMKTFIESGGDPDKVYYKFLDELFLAIPVVGQLESVRRGGYAGIGALALVLKFPAFGKVLVAYSIGEAIYSIYQMEVAAPRRGNMEDAVYRGFAGPELVDFGSPGRPPPMFTEDDQRKLNALKRELRILHKPNINDFPEDPPSDMMMSFSREQAYQQELDVYTFTKNELVEQIKMLEDRDKAFKKYQLGSWQGGLIYGASSFEKQKWINTYILKDVEPEYGFFTKGVVDLTLKYDKKFVSKERSKLQNIIKNINQDIEKRALSIGRLNELNLQQSRYERAQKYFEHAKTEQKEMMVRFKRDSLYPYLEKKRISVEQFVKEWFDKNSIRVVEELTAIGLQPQAMTTMSPSEIEGHMPIIHPLPRKVKLAVIDRLKKDVKRSETLYKRYKELEEGRLKVLAKNIKKSKTLFVGAAVGKSIEKIIDDQKFKDFLTAIRYSSIMRMKPDLDVTIFKVPSNKNRGDSKYSGKTIKECFSLSVSVNLKTDNTLYYAPYKYETSFLCLDKVEKSLSSSTVGKATLLPETKKSISLLKNEYRKELEDESGVIAVVSVFASAMADLSGALPDTLKDLPGLKEDNLKQILIGQRVAFISSNPLKVKLDPIRVQVVDAVGNDLYDDKHADRISVQIGEDFAKVSKGEFWGTHEFTAYDEEIKIILKYTMPDGEILSKEKILSVNDIENWYQPELEKPIRFELPVFAPSSFRLTGKILLNVQKKEKAPKFVRVQNDALGINFSLNMKESPNNSEGFFFDQRNYDLGKGRFSIVLKEAVRRGAVIKLKAFASTKDNKYQGNKSMGVLNKPGLINFEEIKLKPLKSYVLVPTWDENSPPKGKSYINTLEGVGLKGKPKLGKPALEDRLKYCVFKTVPSRGSKVLSGSEVTVFVSDNYNRKVPDVRSLKINDALKILEKNGFKNVKYKINKAADNQKQVYRVETQTVTPGSVFSPDKQIELKIYGKFNPSLSVPDLINSTEDQIKKRFKYGKLKLIIKDRNKIPADKSKSGLVYKQKPLKNSKVGLNEKVYVWIYKEIKEEREESIPPPVSNYVGPQVPYYYVFQMHMPTPKDKTILTKKKKKKKGRLFKKETKAETRERRRKNRLRIDALNVDAVVYNPMPIEKNQIIIHVSKDSLKKYPRQFLVDGEQYVVDIIGKNELVDSSVHTCMLLRAVGGYSVLEDLLNAYPKLRKKKDMGIITFYNQNGIYSKTKKDSSYTVGPIRKGWTRKDKKKAIKLLHLFNCFVASTVYYDVESYKLQTLRSFRDKILANSLDGQVLINKYYQYGPNLAVSLLNNIEFRPFIKYFLDHVVSLLKFINMENKVTVSLFSPLIDFLERYASYIEKIYLFKTKWCKT